MAGNQVDPFKKTAESAQFVSESANAVTSGLAAVEERLRSLPDKFECRVKLSDSQKIDEHLAFARSGKEWGLLVEWKVPTSYSEDVLTVEHKPAVVCDLETRLRCAVALRDLVGQIVYEYSRRRELADLAINSIHESLAMLGMNKEGR